MVLSFCCFVVFFFLSSADDKDMTLLRLLQGPTANREKVSAQSAGAAKASVRRPECTLPGER